MSDPATATAALAAATVYICKTAYELALRARGPSALPPVPVTDTRMQVAIDRQTLLLEDIKEDQKQMRDGVRELVTIQRSSQGRRDR